ncbi:MAG TPA: hypothetical protein VH589_10710 [Trebonia sp.]|jgi:hypothetical protein
MAAGNPIRLDEAQYPRLGAFRSAHPDVAVSTMFSDAWQAFWSRGRKSFVITRHQLPDLLDELDRWFRKPG